MTSRLASGSDRPMSQEDCIQDYMDEIDWRILRSSAMLASAQAETMHDLGFSGNAVAAVVMESIELDLKAKAHGRWVVNTHYHNRRIPHVERQRHELNGRPIGEFAKQLATGGPVPALPVTTTPSDSWPV